ncbi:MAG: TetR family transcriptional regulator [Nannocystaceae bacterium]|nr:TetR family transcriptional regulator [Nannocystaceae bacterium]
MAKTDRRVRRTQRALYDAMIQLILEKGFDAITVAEIAERADVGRSTFYAHYAEKEDLLQGSIDELRAALQQRVDAALSVAESDTHPALSFCLPMAEHVAEFRQLHAMFSHGRGSALVAELMHEMWAGFVRTGWPEGDTLAVEAIAGGFGATISWWLEKAPELAPADVVARFVSLVQPGMARK